MKLGYIRVSNVEQNEERQTRALLDYGIESENLYIDKKSGKNPQNRTETPKNIIENIIESTELLILRRFWINIRLPKACFWEISISRQKSFCKEFLPQQATLL